MALKKTPIRGKVIVQRLELEWTAPQRPAQAGLDSSQGPDRPADLPPAVR